MVQHQDSGDPSGVRGRTSGGTGANGNSVARSRHRKANAAIQMRLGGATWAEIAQVLGYPTPRTALVAVEKALERELSTQGDREQMRRLAGARMERLLRGIWPKAVDSDHPEHLIAATKAREVIAQHSKLFGLDAPTEVIVHSPTLAEIEDWVAKVVAVRGPDVEEFDIIDAEEVQEIEA